MKTAELGTIIQGTLRSEDLIEAFAEELERVDDEKQYVELLRECEAFQDQVEADFDLHGAGELISDLTNALQDAAPDFCYFGASEGDGADFGFWVSDDGLRNGIHDGEVVVRDDGQWPVKFMPDYVYHISDHGNTTLYKITLTPVW